MLTSHLRQLLRNALQSGDYATLPTLVESLSHADRRRCGVLLGEELLPALGEEYWQAFAAVVPADPKAYLGTFLKALDLRLRHDSEGWRNPLLAKFLREQATDIDRRKCAETILPHLVEVDTIEELVATCFPDAKEGKALFLMRTATPQTFFLLFKHLRTIEDDAATLRKYCIALLKRGDSLSFNMAYIIQDYFGLERLPATFSLHLQPYQYSRLEQSFDEFCQLLTNHPSQNNNL